MRKYYIDVTSFGVGPSSGQVNGMIIAEIEPQVEKSENFSTVIAKKLLFVYNPRIFNTFAPRSKVLVKPDGIRTVVDYVVKQNVLRQIFEIK